MVNFKKIWIIFSVVNLCNFTLLAQESDAEKLNNENEDIVVNEVEEQPINEIKNYNIQFPSIIPYEDLDEDGYEGKSNEELFQDVLNRIKEINTLESVFNQYAPDGTFSEGLFYLNKDLGVKFEYKSKDSPLTIFANKETVYVHNKDLQVTDQYPVGKTPLKLFFEDNLKSSDVNILDTKKGKENYEITVNLSDNNIDNIVTFGIDKATSDIRYWIISDPRGNYTAFALRYFKYNQAIPKKIFRIPEAGGLFLEDR